MPGRPAPWPAAGKCSCVTVDPQDAPYVTSRVCGVCEGVHAIASAFALDQAYGIDVPEAGRIMRNLFCAGLYMHDHFIHFYVLSALDYLDILAIAGYKGNDPALVALRDKVVSLVKSGDTSPFTPRYNPDEYSRQRPGNSHDAGITLH